MGQKINSFHELRVYQEACALDLLVFDLSKSFPKEETYSLTDQMRRASRSIGSNIAEAWAKRRYPAHFVSKLTDSDGELQETRHWSSRAKAYGYITEVSVVDIFSRCERIGRMLGKMINSPEGFT